MKTFFVFTTFAFVLANAVFANGGKEIKGNGNIVTSERTVSAFDGILLDSSIHVRFHTDSRYRLTITTDSNLESAVGITVKDNALVIGTSMTGQPKFTQCRIDVYAPRVSSVSISGAGVFEIDGGLTVPSFQAVISGSGTARGTLQCETFQAIIYGEGDISLEGSARISKIVITGTASIDCSGFQTGETTVIPTGKGGVEKST